MSGKEAVAIAVAEVPSHYSEFQRIVTVFTRRRVSVFGFVLIVLLILTAVFAPQLAPYDPYQINLDQTLLLPSSNHLLGTDTLGRDTLSRIIYGSRTSLMISIFAVVLGAIIGQSLGLIAGYFGGWWYAVIMRFIDAIMCMPSILIAIVISVVLGGGIKNVIIALAVGVVPMQARLMCAQVLTVKQNDYILSGKAKGASNIRMMVYHIIPNAFPPLLVAMTIDLGLCILGEAALSFLGVGINPPTPAWGSMVRDGYTYLLTNPVLPIAPGFAIMLVVFGFNMTGDGLRDALDPRLRGAF